MSRILAVGNATLDIINVVAEYPEEDQEVRASTQQRRRGGNACNTLAVLSQLGHQCSWAGTLADEPDARAILADLDEHQISYSSATTLASGKVPTSYVSLSRQTGSRTIVHYRDLPEYGFDAFKKIDLAVYDWLHFEGRNITELERMMTHARSTQPGLRISLEVEKVREGIEQLFPYADLLLFSREYAQHCNADGAQDFLQALQLENHHAIACCTWGDKGAWARDSNGTTTHAPALTPAKVVDTLGAGDTFNARMIDQLVQGKDLQQALTSAVNLAGKKCGIYGLKGLIGN